MQATVRMDFKLSTNERIWTLKTHTSWFHLNKIQKISGFQGPVLVGEEIYVGAKGNFAAWHVLYDDCGGGGDVFVMYTVHAFGKTH